MILHNMKQRILSSVMWFASILTFLPLAGLGWFFTSCSDDDSDAPLTFYSSVRLTAAGFIEADEAQFSEFKAILEKGNYLGMLKTYGSYTVFAPTNSAIQQYLQENGYASVDELPVEKCDTLSRTHIIQGKAVFTSDIGDEVTPTNMNEGYITMTADSDATNNNALVVYVNQNSRIIERDDSVTNGVVHIVDKIINSSNKMLPLLMEENPNLSIFCQALRETGLIDSLMKYVDTRYTVDPDSAISKDGSDTGFKVAYGTANGGGSGSKQCQTYYPLNRFYKFTAFVETDSIYALHEIHNLDDLKAYAKRIYDESYPQDAGKYDNDFTDRRNPLNRFVSYHLINCKGSREKWVHCKGTIYAQKFLVNVANPEDYYETMAPHALIRFCSNANEEIYINRKESYGIDGKVMKNKFAVRGVRVLKAEESAGYTQDCDNGIYHYIDDILVYSDEVRHDVLNRRIRIDGSTLSPDFMNSEARMGFMGQSEMMIGYKNGFLDNFKMNNTNTFIGCSNEQVGWRHYQGSGVCITGEKFDASVKLPPVPYDGTYEVRLGYSLGDDRGIAQIYLNNNPCGIPVTFRTFDTNAGWESDYTEGSILRDEDEIKAIDKSMRNLGYMKAMDSYGSESEPFRTYGNTLRRILVRQFMRADQDYWLRFRQILDGATLYMSIDYIELCPKDVYDNPEGEDRH